MVFLEKFLDFVCNHAAVVNEDESALQTEVDMVKKKYGPWMRVRGFTSFHQLFYALHLAKAKKRPYCVAFIKKNASPIGEIVLKHAIPNVKTYKYSDTQDLTKQLPVLQ